MRAKALLLSLFFSLVLLSVACDAAHGITATKIKDILDHPRDYQSQEITVYGTVTNAVSLLVIKYYEVQDGTGSIKVVTDNLLPARGEKLRVTGRTTVIELGTERWIVLRENNDSTAQGVNSKVLKARHRYSIKQFMLLRVLTVDFVLACGRIGKVLAI
jgi:hypothetical protein